MKDISQLKLVEKQFKEFVKAKYKSKIRSFNSGKPNKRLWYFGCHYTEGYQESEIQDEAWEFTQDVLDSASVVDIPTTSYHNNGVQMGKVCFHFRDKMGKQYNVGYIDDCTKEGVETQEQMLHGTLRELSLMNETAFIGKSIKDEHLQILMVPVHMSTVPKGQKPGCHILGLYLQDFSRKGTNRMADAGKESEKKDNESFLQTQPDNAMNSSASTTASIGEKKAAVADTNSGGPTDEELAEIAQSIPNEDFGKNGEGSKMAYLVFNLLKNNKTLKSKMDDQMKIGEATFSRIKSENENLRAKINATERDQRKSTINSWSEAKAWMQKHKGDLGEASDVVDQLIKTVPQEHLAGLEVLFSTARAAGAAADNNLGIQKTKDFQKRRQEESIEDAKDRIKRMYTPSTITDRFEGPQNESRIANQERDSANRDIWKQTHDKILQASSSSGYKF